jgi:hypothetical protein
LLCGTARTEWKLAAAIRRLWSELEVPTTLRQWVEAAAANSRRTDTGVTAQIHREIWDQMQAWLENVERFPSERMPLRSGCRSWKPASAT